jgi:hypothetical protein
MLDKVSKQIAFIFAHLQFLIWMIIMIFYFFKGNSDLFMTLFLFCSIYGIILGHSWTIVDHILFKESGWNASVWDLPDDPVRLKLTMQIYISIVSMGITYYFVAIGNKNINSAYLAILLGINFTLGLYCVIKLIIRLLKPTKIINKTKSK